MAQVFADRVMVTTTSTGVGDITPGSPVIGFQAFPAWIVDGDTFTYTIFAVDGSGVPTGAWETGYGTWNAGVIERTDPIDGSAATPVSFAAGAKYIALSVISDTMLYFNSFPSYGSYDLTPASETLTRNRNGLSIRFTYAGAKTLTIPTDASELFDYGFRAFLYNDTAGDLTISPAGGVVVAGASLVIPSKCGAMLQRHDADDWYLVAMPAAQQRGAVVKKAADQTAADYSTATAVAWDAEISDTSTIHDNATNNTRLTVPSGVTRVKLKVNLELANVTADTWVAVKMRKNGAAFDGQGSQSVETGNTTVYLNAESAVVTVSGGDYFDVTLQAEDTSIDVVAAGSWFSMEIVL